MNYEFIVFMLAVIFVIAPAIAYIFENEARFWDWLFPRRIKYQRTQFGYKKVRANGEPVEDK
jgi:hypothetical protein